MGLSDFVKGKKAKAEEKVACKECGEKVAKKTLNADGLCEDCAPESGEE